MHRKKKHRKHGHRRHRIGAASLNPGSPMVKLGATAVGYFLAADPINGAIDKANTKPATATEPATTRLNPKIIGVAEAGIGVALLMGKKPSMVKAIAGGILAGAGLKRLLKEFGVVSGYRVNGYQSVPVIGAAKSRMGGYQSVPVIGASTPAQLMGAPAQLQGYTSAGSGIMGTTEYGSGYMR